jgi:anti-sigma factor ChrR (cupin superfamily)
MANAVESGVEWVSIRDAKVAARFPGIRVRQLWCGPSGAKALVVEIDAGARWGELDVHEPGPEEVFVVSGVFNDGVREYPAGTFIHNPAGSSHVPQSEVGCTLFVFYPEG